MEDHGSFVAVTVVAELAGEIATVPFEGRFRYLRIWARTDGDFRIVSGSVTALC